MATFKKRFHSRNHVEGQLIQASELIEMQRLQFQTYCNIEADRYGLNPDGSFTPHVISGLVPSIVAGQQRIKIGRGHGWITNSLSNVDERIPIILEEDLYVDIPAGDATHPSWCHVLLVNLTPGKNVTYGPATVGVKDVNGIITPLSADLYMQKVTTTAVLSEGIPAALPECNAIIGPNLLPIATVYIPAGFSGEVDPANLYDVRWFAPGYGSLTLERRDGETSFEIGRGWKSLQMTAAPFDTGGGTYVEIIAPNPAVFNLIPNLSLSASCLGAGSSPGYIEHLMSAFLQARHIGDLGVPLIRWTGYVKAYKTDGSGQDTTDNCPRLITITCNPVI